MSRHRVFEAVLLYAGVILTIAGATIVGAAIAHTPPRICIGHVIELSPGGCR